MSTETDKDTYWARRDELDVQLQQLRVEELKLVNAINKNKVLLETKFGDEMNTKHIGDFDNRRKDVESVIQYRVKHLEVMDKLVAIDERQAAAWERVATALETLASK